MGVRFPSVQSNTLLTAVLVTTTETAVVTTPPLTISLDFSVILLFLYAAFTGGTASTAIAARIRRGSGTGGTQVNVTANTPNGAAVNDALSMWYFDTPGAVAGQQYTLTLQQLNATGNGSIQDAALLAFAL